MELDATAWVSFFSSTNLNPLWSTTTPLLATATESETGSLVLSGVLLSLVVIYLASKIGGELCARINFPPVLGVLNPAVPSNREGLIMAIFLIVVAILGKVVTGFTVFGQPQINRLAIGVGMIPRGEVGLIFAGVGSDSGALSEATEAAIIMMVNSNDIFSATPVTLGVSRRCDRL